MRPCSASWRRSTRASTVASAAWSCRSAHPPGTGLSQRDLHPPGQRPARPGRRPRRAPGARRHRLGIGLPDAAGDAPRAPGPRPGRSDPAVWSTPSSGRGRASRRGRRRRDASRRAPTAGARARARLRPTAHPGPLEAHSPQPLVVRANLPGPTAQTTAGRAPHRPSDRSGQPRCSTSSVANASPSPAAARRPRSRASRNWPACRTRPSRAWSTRLATSRPRPLGACKRSSTSWAIGPTGTR